MLLGHGRLLDRPLLLDDGGAGGAGAADSLDLHREWLDIWRLRMRLGGHDLRDQGQALQRREAEDTGVDVPMRTWNQD
jgi:hypothetical protein